MELYVIWRRNNYNGEDGCCIVVNLFYWIKNMDHWLKGISNLMCGAKRRNSGGWREEDVSEVDMMGVTLVKYFYL